MSSAYVPVPRIIAYALLTSLAALSIDAVLPAMRVIESEFVVSPPLTAHHLIPLFILGMVFGELAFGPVADAIGRKMALLSGLAIFIAGTLLAIFAPTFELVILGRILQGIGVSGPKIATRAIVRDQFEGEAMARIMSLMFMIIICVPMLAPALGQALMTVTGWRGIFVAYLVMAVGLGLWLIMRQPETLAPADRIPLNLPALMKNGGKILSSARAATLIVATGFVFGAQLLYLSTAADLFNLIYGINEMFPAYFAALSLSIGIAFFINAQLVVRFGMMPIMRVALIGMTGAGLLLVVVSLAFDGRPPLAIFMALGFMAFFCVGMMYGNINAMAMQPLKRLAGLGASLFSSLSSLIAVVFTLIFTIGGAETTLPLAIAFSVSGIVAFWLLGIATRADATPIEPSFGTIRV